MSAGRVISGRRHHVLAHHSISCMPCHPHHFTQSFAALLGTASALLSGDARRSTVMRREAACGIAADSLLTVRTSPVRCVKARKQLNYLVHGGDAPLEVGQASPDAEPDPCWRSFMGESPRMRGEHWPPRSASIHSLGLPACPGSTSSIHWSPCPAPDHPHVRGEHTQAKLDAAAIRGSPPQRGEHKNRSISSRRCVGSPRMRGEHGSPE
jgi:hypothetical protein